MGLGREAIKNAIENSYVNEGANEAVSMLENLGYLENTDESEIQLQMLA
jgi:hypothetical protein